ncbi:hypothetical protein L210DRAFT_3539793 [Boletus edulis BED1]|uniref:NAD(P)-binding protein n=1 Tax=Boletus edulis BED1 TaxID=1328754 RepID=A0AAD4BVL7_BOLED|nr:hypothetical protein L210DRAFT_3539793 [Boletus edulis BED1]
MRLQVVQQPSRCYIMLSSLRTRLDQHYSCQRRPSHIVFGPVMHSRATHNSVFSNCAKWRLSKAKRTNLEVISPRHFLRFRIAWIAGECYVLSTTVTGASSGFGKALTEVVLRKGDIVVATLRKPSVLATLTKQYPPSQLLLLALDVTRPSDISAAFTRTQEVFGRLDVVFNNAGYGYFGEVEAIPDENARALLEVNFWGAVGVSRAAVKFFREVNAHGKGGILLQNSSMLGISGGPGVTLEGFTDSFSKEIPPEWNIKICILQPGSFDTKLLSGTFFAPHPAYGNSATVTRRDFYRNVVPEGDPYKFAEMLHQLVVGADEGEKMPFFLPIGEDALAKLRHRLKRMGKTLVDVTPLSTDMKKDGKKAKTMAKL